MSITAIVLLSLGVLFLLIELLLLPGFTLPGVIGGLLVLSGVVWAAWQAHSIVMGLVYAAATAGVTIPLALLGLWLLPRTPAGRLFILQSSERGDEGFQASSPGLMAFVGKSGTTVTPLRPSGTAVIDGARVDVVTQGDFIEKGTEVEVIMVEGNRVVVSPTAT